MLCPEGELTEPTGKLNEEKLKESHTKNIHTEGEGSLELNTFKNPKTWKKSISNFFRHQLRSTKSNDGDHAAGSQEDYEDKEMSPDQKWQSLGKIFRRPSFADNWNKSLNQQGECSSQNKKLSVKRVLSSYFGKSQKSFSTVQALPDED